MTRFLAWCGAHARWFLIGGLLVGGFLRPVAEAFLPLVGPAIAVLLFLACFRTGPRAAAGSPADLTRTLCAALILQICVPLLALGVGLAVGMPHAVLAPLVLLLAASSVTVVPHFLAILGMDTSHAVRLLLVGTLALPATAWLTFTVTTQAGLSAFEEPAIILQAVFRLLLVIAGAAGLAFALRVWWVRELTPRLSHWTEGTASIALAVVVIGLMAPMGAALWERPGELLSTLALAFAINLSLQSAAWALGAKVSRSRAERATYAAVNGNRNFALFLTALPLSVMEPMLLFIACYQVPNYLTPFIFKRLYAPKHAAAELKTDAS
ncbi:MAG: hypothetical protein AAF737_09685 [Pseudomonadota bacterium]